MKRRERFLEQTAFVDRFVIYIFTQSTRKKQAKFNRAKHYLSFNLLTGRKILHLIADFIGDTEQVADYRH